ncbi:MAG: NDP-sugar synthase [Thermoplasmata archaeon]
MQAVILAGGLGTRLRPLTETTPKPLLPLLNKPLVLHIIDALPKNIKEVILAVNYKKELLEEYFQAHDVGRDIKVISEPVPLGTGGAIKNIEKYVNDSFVAFNGDAISSINVKDIIEFHKTKNGKDIIKYHKKKKCIGTIALWKVEDVSHFGVVELKNYKIKSFKEKPKPNESPSNLINAGVYVLETEIFDYIEPNKTVSIEKEVFPKIIDKGLYGFSFKGYWIDVGRPETYLEAQRILLDNKRNKNINKKYINKKFKSVLMGKNCQIPDKAGIGKYVCIGDNVSMGEDVKIKNSAIMNGTKIGNNATITDSIIGFSCVLKENAVIKSGCVLGDGCVVEKDVELKSNTNVQPKERVCG